LSILLARSRKDAEVLQPNYSVIST